MSAKTKINSVLGSVAGILLVIFGKRKYKVNADDLKRAEFKTSTQRMGIRFTERLREVFRLIWIRKIK